MTEAERQLDQRDDKFLWDNLGNPNVTRWTKLVIYRDMMMARRDALQLRRAPKNS
jgi:hypothetical protein